MLIIDLLWTRFLSQCIFGILDTIQWTNPKVSAFWFLLCLYLARNPGYIPFAFWCLLAIWHLSHRPAQSDRANSTFRKAATCASRRPSSRQRRSRRRVTSRWFRDGCCHDRTKVIERHTSRSAAHIAHRCRTSAHAPCHFYMGPDIHHCDAIPMCALGCRCVTPCVASTSHIVR